uniref:Lysophospholipase n=1 Tax=Puccinia cf. psidii AE-2014 TaxID=1505670 RepID=A0A060IHQ3_9BASI|nr:patatin and cPLA2 [Puccinia cf. psidii AE-2014]
MTTSLRFFLLRIFIFGTFGGHLCAPSEPVLQPRFVKCPTETILRSTLASDSKQTLNVREANYIEARRAQVARPAYAKYLKNVQFSLAQHATGINLSCSCSFLPKYVEKILGGGDLSLLPRTGIAISGGGMRATLYSLGILKAFEGNNPKSVELGTGGLFNSIDYLSGLSGGSWTVVGLAYGAYDLTKASIEEARNMLIEYDLFNVRFLRQFLIRNFVEKSAANDQLYIADAFSKMAAKVNAGFRVTFADLWGLLLRFHIVGTTTPSNFFNFSEPHGAGATFSGIADLSVFQSFQQPYPIITALGLSLNQNQSDIEPAAFVPLKSTQYEFTVHESGSWDKHLASFISTKYLGTRLKAGIPIDHERCVNDFDKAHYLAAISSDIFASLNTSDYDFREKSNISPFVNAISQQFSSSQPGISIDTASVPNPFFEYGQEDFPERNQLDLRLLDGGLGAVTPYQPLLISARKLDLVIGVDAISLQEVCYHFSNYATGASLRASFKRASLYHNIRFPRVPESEEEYLKLRQHPTFFGCEETETPLVVWLPNAPPIDGSPGITNTSYQRIQVSNDEAEKIISAASQIAYRGFPTDQQIKDKMYRDPLWGGCLACAVVDRSRFRLGVKREGLCSYCFQRYCWNG